MRLQFTANTRSIEPDPGVLLGSQTQKQTLH